jgi:flagellar hook-associated protein 3 FlgL
MRITNQIITEKYLRSLNNIATDLDKLNSQFITGRKFMKVSENTPAAVKGFQIRRDMKRVEGYKDSITHAKGMLNNAESTIMNIQEMVKEAKVKILDGMNGSKSVDERKIIATELRNLQHEMLQRLNSNASGLYYFGGNSVAQEPFSVASDGKLPYRYKDGADFKWVKLEDLHSVPDPSLGPVDPMHELYKELMGAGLFVDLGMGVRSDTSASSPSAAPYIDRNSVFTYTLPGVSLTGVGSTEMSDGAIVSNNLYDLLGSIVANFDDGFDDGKGGLGLKYTYERANELFGILEKNEITVQYAITEAGTKMHYLEFVSKAMDSREFDNVERQNDTEGAPREKTIIYYEAQKLSYQAALQMGTQVIPMSIFDYMR